MLGLMAMPNLDDLLKDFQESGSYDFMAAGADPSKETGLYSKLLKVPHVLLAGATNSGKSTIINGMIYTLLTASAKLPRNYPAGMLILIDPKRVELSPYRNCRLTLDYASEPYQITKTLQSAARFMDKRYQKMQRRGQRKSTEIPVYVIIDEYADLMTLPKATAKEVKLQCQRLAQLGRAANVHLILATQRPTRDIIDGAIKVNLDYRVALRCPTAQDSRNIIDMKGAEELPQFGQCYLRTPMGVELITDIPLIEDHKIYKALEAIR